MTMKSKPTQAMLAAFAAFLMISPLVPGVAAFQASFQALGLVAGVDTNSRSVSFYTENWDEGPDVEINLYKPVGDPEGCMAEVGFVTIEPFGLPQTSLGASFCDGTTCNLYGGITCTPGPSIVVPGAPEPGWKYERTVCLDSRMAGTTGAVVVTIAFYLPKDGGCTGADVLDLHVRPF